jgi:hypothetical protein
MPGDPLRIGDRRKIVLELCATSGAPSADPFYSLWRDYLQIELARYF